MNLGIARIIIFAISLFAFSSCSEKPFAVEHAAEKSPVRQTSVFVVDHGWHTGFVVPASKMNADFPFLRSRFGGAAPYYELGWGDKGFYQTHEVTTGLTLRAMFWSSGSVVHIVSVPESPPQYFSESEVIEIKLSENEFNDLRKFIGNSFSYDSQGNVIKLTTGLYGDSQFYEGSGSYYIFNTCNKWTAKGLKSTGMDISPAFKLTAGSIMNYFKDRKP